MRSLDRPTKRRRKLMKRVWRHKADALLVTNTRNVYYLTGFRGDDSALIVAGQSATLVTDSRYAEEAEEALQGVRLVVRKKGMMQTAADVARRAGIRRLGVEALSLTVRDEEDLRKAAGKMEIVRTTGLVEDLRLIKDAGEIAEIRAAIALAEDAFRASRQIIRPGMTELEAARLLDRTMQDLGADGPAFPTICAAGPRASLPHAVPTNRRIQAGEPVLFDWGAKRRMYHSDLTRMVCWDRIPRLFAGWYGYVLEAQRRALARVRPGERAAHIDRAARDYLRSHRHGRHFGHGLGHGIGLDVHEPPGIRSVLPARLTARKQDAAVRPGMVFSVEPGIYIPGRGGVRIEDLVLVTRAGRSVLTSVPKSLESCLVG